MCLSGFPVGRWHYINQWWIINGVDYGTPDLTGTRGCKCPRFMQPVSDQPAAVLWRLLTVWCSRWPFDFCYFVFRLAAVSPSFCPLSNDTGWVSFSHDLSLINFKFIKSLCSRAEQSHLIYNLRSSFNVNLIFLVGIRCKFLLLFQFKHIYFISACSDRPHQWLRPWRRTRRKRAVAPQDFGRPSRPATVAATWALPACHR